MRETFAVYAKNWRPLVVIALAPEVPLLVAVVTPGALSIALIVAALIVYLLVPAATTYAVARHHLGQGVDAIICFKRAWHRVLSLVTVYVVTVAALIGSMLLSFIIIGIPLFFYLLVIWFFAVPVTMLERRRGPIAALGRSAALVKGSWRRVFAIGIVFVVIFVGLALAILVPVAILTFINETLGGFAGTVLFTLLGPIVPIGATLVYIDLRVRKEGYNVDAMAAELGHISATG